MWRKIGVVVAVLFCIGLVMRGLDAIGLIEIDQPPRTAEQQNAHGRIEAHAYNTGLVSARAGAKRPTGEELDAICRRAAVDLGEKAGWGFKAVWKDMFWKGWKAGGG